MKKSDYVSHLSNWIDSNTDMLPMKSGTGVSIRTLASWENGHRQERNWRKVVSDVRDNIKYTVWECSVSVVDPSVIYLVATKGDDFVDVFTGSHKYFSEYFGKSLCRE